MACVALGRLSGGASVAHSASGWRVVVTRAGGVNHEAGELMPTTGNGAGADPAPDSEGKWVHSGLRRGCLALGPAWRTESSTVRS